MATWKKIIVSGSSADLSNLVVDNVISASILSGSHVGDGSGLTRISAETASYILGANVDGAVTTSLSASHAEFADDAANAVTAETASYVQTESIVNFDTAVSAAAAAAGIGDSQPDVDAATGSLLTTASFSGETITFTKGDASTFTLDVIPEGVLSGSAQIATEISGAFDAASASFSTRVTTNSASIAALDIFSSSLDATYATMEEVNDATGSLLDSASFSGEELTIHYGNGTSESIDIIPEGVLSSSAQITDVSSSYIGDGLITGTDNEVDVDNTTSGSYQIGLPQDVTIGRNLTVTGDLTVSGTQTNVNVTNLDVEDKFILLNSGSVGAGDGGIVISQGSQTGAAIGYDSSDTRFAIQTSLAATATTITPDAFIAAVIEGSGDLPSAVGANFVKKGNIFIGNNEDIYIYS